jgi:hypothetical protein
MMGAVLLAHQGGWDEILLVLLPVGLFAFLLFVANKRAEKIAEHEDQEERNEEGEPTA